MTFPASTRIPLDHMEQPGPFAYRGLVDGAGQSHMGAKLPGRSPTMEQYSTDQIWVGLDVHQSSITAAVLHGQTHDPEIVRTRSDLNAVRRLSRRLSHQGTPRGC